MTKGIHMDFTTIRKNLERNGFAVSCFETVEAVNDYLAEKIKGEIVGFGGSVTLQEMGLYEKLEKNNTIEHNPLVYEVYISSEGEFLERPEQIK